ncbi:hypothetical protein D917_04364 [Trichinella nativa]|uniref:Uncharacterized protein n=1 Tax=Trichinella nativa TaxID=6335 RepID=A0A1Y3E8A7_9BILA|nr:hypothetical protein D917_04364 [Trichinella nativa]
MCNTEFSDLTFDTADLLPGDTTSENLGNFFADSTMPDPGEFIQYFESTNFGEFGLSTDRLDVPLFDLEDGKRKSVGILDDISSNPSKLLLDDHKKTANPKKTHLKEEKKRSMAGDDDDDPLKPTLLSSSEMDDILSLLQS